MKAYCWGSNGRGIFGIGTSSEVNANPVVVDETRGIKSVSGYAAFNCILSEAGDILCAGDLPKLDVLGNGETITSIYDFTPIQNTAVKFIQLKVGSENLSAYILILWSS